LPWRERWIQHRGVVYTLFDVFSYPHTHTHTHTQRYRDAKDLFNCGCFGFIRLFQKRQRWNFESVTFSRHWNSLTEM
jgi:hypothetical protein